MVWIARDFHQLSIFDVIQERACVRAILRASTPDDVGFAYVDGHRRSSADESPLSASG
jgi:hypothetical protein